MKLPFALALLIAAARRRTGCRGARRQSAGQTPPPLEVSVTGGVSAPMPIAIPAMPTTAAVDTPPAPPTRSAASSPRSSPTTSGTRGLFTPLAPGRCGRSPFRK